MSAERAGILSTALRKSFYECYGREPRLFSAPGRINLIGEHTDYNEGYVLPMAIDRRIGVAAAPRTDRRVRAFSAGFESRIEFEIASGLSASPDWGNLVRGMAACLDRAGHDLQGADLWIAGEVPIGAGLGSSAALGIAVGFALLALSRQAADLRILATAARLAEHEFTGTLSGIMDQFTACYAQSGRALLIDCRSLEHRPAEIDFDTVRVVACNSNVRHDLASSAYNQRVEECREALRLLAREMPGLSSLRDVAPDDLERHAHVLPDVYLRRCRHVVTENVRTLDAAAAIEQGDYERVGRLMSASHSSLRDDYEVSCRELDQLVELASSCEGVFGARMTGGGFGGCTVNLVAREHTESFVTVMRERYERLSGIRPDIFVCSAADGVRED